MLCVMCACVNVVPRPSFVVQRAVKAAAVNESHRHVVASVVDRAHRRSPQS